MINPIAARISFPANGIKNTAPTKQKTGPSSFANDSFTFNANKVEEAQAGSAENKNFLEVFFGKVTKEPKITQYEKMLYSKTKNKEELIEFFENYQPLIKW